MKDRTAIDTIKGYFYQFDYSILKLLELKEESESITIEGIEDVDLKTAKEDTAIQCKYYSKTEYNHSVISKPIRLMLNHFKEVKNGNKQKINYKLYGCFKSGQSKLTLPIDVDFLKKNFLTYTKDGTKHLHYDDLVLNDIELTEFVSLLTIDINAFDYDDQLSKIFNLIQITFNCNVFEAEHFYYNNALKTIKDIAVEGDITQRKISKLSFLTKINLKNLFFNEWFVEYKGKSKLFSDLRNQYFSNLNISSFERFFLIEIPTLGYLRSDLKELIFMISKKWSKLSKREPNPFCPYIYIHNISDSELLELKKELYSEEFLFIDGFDFSGASFNPKSLAKTANNEFKIKIINNLTYVDLTIAEITKTKEIYQFFTINTFYNTSVVNIKRIDIQINKLTDIKKII